MRFFKDNNVPDDLSMIFEHTIHAFSYIIKHNESISLSEFAKRISNSYCLGARNLVCIHSLLVFDGNVSKFGNQLKLENLSVIHDTNDFPTWSGWNKWSELKIRNWIDKKIYRLAEIEIFYPSISMANA